MTSHYSLGDTREGSWSMGSEAGETPSWDQASA